MDIKDPLPTLNRKILADTYIRGNGIEIGALHNPLLLPSHASVKYIDRFPIEELRKHYPAIESQHLTRVDIVDDGENLTTIADISQDFLIANHFLEHCQDPIKAFKNFFRVLRPSGILYLAIPDKRHSFDRQRPVTPLNHLIADHIYGPERSRKAHYREWVHLVCNIEEKEKVQRIFDYLTEINYSIHFHVWTQKEMLEFIAYMRSMIDFEIKAFLEHTNECVFVLEKADMSW